MDNSSQRKISRVSPNSEIPVLAGEITAALMGDGPCLGFGQVNSTLAPSSAAVVIGTSGSTGTPKEIYLSAQAILSSARASNKFIGAKPGDTWSLLLPLTHIAAVNVTVRAMELGTLPIDLSNFEGDYPRVNFTAIVPTQLFRAIYGDSRLLKHLQSADAVLVGGAALSQGLRNQAQASGIKIITTYGMTETCGGCVYNGKALEGVEVDIRGGKIYLRGAMLALSLKLIDGWFETNDLGEIRDGLLEVIGRSDDVIITGGENLSLDAVENSLAKGFPHLQCAAFSIDDPHWGHSLHLAVVGDADDAAINAHLIRELGAHAKPKGINHCSSLPLLGIGKVDRKRLAMEFANE